MRVSAVAVAGVSLTFAGLRAWGQVAPDPPALCSASLTSWETVKNDANASRLKAILNRTPNACVNLRAGIEQQIQAVSAAPMVRKVRTAGASKRAVDTAKADDGAESLNRNEAKAITAMGLNVTAPNGPYAQAGRAGPPAPGTIVQDCRNCPSMIAIPGGEFVMGSTDREEGRSNDEGPDTTVVIPPFWMSRFEITFDQWDECVRDGGCGGYSPPDSGWGRGARPVIFVSWSDAAGYAAWLSWHTGHLYRLPSESEWEYAARAGTHGEYGFNGNVSEICKYGNVADRTVYPAGSIRCSDGYGHETAPVGRFLPNAFGLYDMIGNVSELVADCYHNSLLGENTRGRPYESRDCDAHVIKGSAWGLWLPEPANNEVRISARFHAPDGNGHGGNGYGFRLARDIDN